MRLLLVVPSYYPEAYGGAERQASLLADALGKLGVHVTLLAPSLRPQTPLETPTAFGTVRRIRVRDFPSRGGRYLLSTLAWTWKVRAEIVRRRAEIDLVYVFHGRLHVAGPLLGARAARLPIFVKPGGGGANADLKALRRKRFVYGHMVATMKLRWATGFIAVSGEIEQDLLSAGVEAGRIRRLSNGVKLIDAARLDVALAARTGRRFISVCRLVHDKNVDVLVEALAATPGAELTLVGDGPELQALQTLAQRLGVASRVRFLGALKDVTSELLAHDAFLTASVHEGQSNALLEAFAAGVIPIAADASGVGDLIDAGRDGLVVQAPNTEVFAQAMARLLSLSAADRTAMSRAAYAKAKANFAIEAIAERLLAIFRSTLERAR